ncbi:gap junction gamma-1 protein [Crotalus adamanteus]|uniref:Gap junction gamma-1 protein n=1 Tax=Crotalus adamanteus TaxID=8729 RepID=A0AAW1B4D8_CROAD
MYLGYAAHKIARIVEHGETERKLRSKPLLMRWKQHRGLEEAEDDNEEDPMMYPEIEVESERENKQNPSFTKIKHDVRPFFSLLNGFRIATGINGGYTAEERRVPGSRIRSEESMWTKASQSRRSTNSK